MPKRTESQDSLFIMLVAIIQQVLEAVGWNWQLAITGQP